MVIFLGKTHSFMVFRLVQNVFANIINWWLGNRKSGCRLLPCEKPCYKPFLIDEFFCTIGNNRCQFYLRKSWCSWHKNVDVFRVGINGIEFWWVIFDNSCNVFFNLNAVFLWNDVCLKWVMKTKWVYRLLNSIFIR